MKIILYENKNIANLYPITLTRPSFDILCGGATLYQLLKQEFKTAKFDFWVRKYLANVIKQNFNSAKAPDTKILFLDGAVAPSAVTVADIVKKIKPGNSLVFKHKNKIVGGWLDLKQLQPQSRIIERLRTENISDLLKQLKVKSVTVAWPVIDNLWDVIAHNETILPENLQQFKKKFKQYQPGVYIGRQVKIEPAVTFVSNAGPIVINDGTWVKSRAVLRGPLYVGKNCIVNSYAELKHSACIGDVCKVGGEIEVSVMQGYSNKQHAGFLGNSYVGAWVNLGGGTSNSDLKNTYGVVKMRGQDTGRKFLGCVVGDYCKTAINTAIFSGKVVGVNSFLYGVITKDVPSFTNAGSWLKRWISCPLAVAHKVQAIMFSRRGKKVSATDARLLKDVFELTKADRKLARVADGKVDFIS